MAFTNFNKPFLAFSLLIVTVEATMRKILTGATLIFVLFFSASCSIWLGTELAVMSSLTEVNSNFSSLLFDKTKAKKESFFESKYDNLTSNPIIYVLPVKIETPNGFHYDNSMQLVLKNYIKENKFGEITESHKTANYHLVAKVKETLNSSFNKNSSYIEITLLDINNKPYFFTKVKMISKSDRNFFYFPRKESKPVSYLTIKGFKYILEKSLYKAFKEEKNA